MEARFNLKRLEEIAKPLTQEEIEKRKRVFERTKYLREHFDAELERLKKEGKI